jgi:hypothetical protein
MRPLHTGLALAVLVSVSFCITPAESIQWLLRGKHPDPPEDKKVENDQRRVKSQPQAQYLIIGPKESPNETPFEPPTETPTGSPSESPTSSPTAGPSTTPTSSPSIVPSSTPSHSPSAGPSEGPSLGPSASPSISPSNTPSAIVSANPSATPSLSPNASPSTAPSIIATNSTNMSGLAIESSSSVNATNTSSGEDITESEEGPEEATGTPTNISLSTVSPSSAPPTSAEPYAAPEPEEETDEAEEAEDEDFTSSETKPPTTASPTTVAPTTAAPSVVSSANTTYLAEFDSSMPFNATNAAEYSAPVKIAPDGSGVASLTSEIKESLEALEEAAAQLESKGIEEEQTEEKEEDTTAEEAKAAGPKKFFEGYKWEDLPMNAKAAAMNLGYDESIWDGDKSLAFSSSKSWSELTVEEEMAAIILGYAQDTWDSSRSKAATSASEGKTSSTTDNWNFDDESKLTTTEEAETAHDENVAAIEDQDTQADAETTIENEGTTPETEASPEVVDTDAKEVNADAAAVTDTAAIAATSEEADIAEDDYFDYSWSDLPVAAKYAARVLGYNRNSWNYDEIVKTSYLYWHELSADEMSAAKTLGYSREKWDAQTTAFMEDEDFDEEKEDGGEAEAELEGEEKVETEEKIEAVAFFADDHAGEEQGNDMDEDAIEAFFEDDEDGNDMDEQAIDPFFEDEDDEVVTTTEAGEEGKDPLKGKKPKKRNQEPSEKIVGKIEPEMDELKNEVGSLQKQLKDALEMLKMHEQALKALQGLPEDATISSVQELIALGERRKKKDRSDEKEQLKKPVS